MDKSITIIISIIVKLGTWRVRYMLKSLFLLQASFGQMRNIFLVKWETFSPYISKWKFMRLNQLYVAERNTHFNSYKNISHVIHWRHSWNSTKCKDNVLILKSIFRFYSISHPRQREKPFSNAQCWVCVRDMNDAGLCWVCYICSYPLKNRSQERIDEISTIELVSGKVTAEE